MTLIEDLWLRILERPGSAGTFRLFDDAHPLDLYAGVDLEGRRVLMLVTDQPPPELPTDGVIEVGLTQRNDGRFNLVFRLGRPEYQEIFAQLCQDLVEASRDSDRQNGTGRLLLRLERWKKLLESGPRQGLSDEQLRGLFGELWFLRTVAIPLVGPLAAVHAWKGPLGAPQDFQLSNALVEIKTVLPGSHKVSISSAEQLEHGDTPLQLAVVIVDPTQGDSVVTVIEDLRRELAVPSAAATEFELRLAEVGYSERPEHAQSVFSVQGTKYYAVDEGFPSIVLSRLPPGVSGVAYDVDLLHCGPYRSEYIHVAR
jgi:hypothetical protein